MKYTVLWVSKAEQELAATWTAAADRSAVAEAANRIDDQLRTRPEDLGESREEGRRVLLESPLGVTFVVEPADRTVSVLAVWQFEPRRQQP